MTRSIQTRALVAFMIIATGVIASGCVGAGTTGAGAGTGTRYADDGSFVCAEPGTVNVRSANTTHAAEVTLFAQDCPPPVFDGDGSYCLPTDCFSYTYWWLESECTSLLAEVVCTHESRIGPDERIIIHDMTFKTTREFRFQVSEFVPGGNSIILYEMDAVLTRANV